MNEASHPWNILHQAGYEIDFVSPQGGKAPVDSFNLEDPINAALWNHPDYQQKLKNTLRPDEVDPADFAAIHYVGGHVTMWDFAKNEAFATIAATIYEAGGVASAVCHGPAGLVNIKLSDGTYLAAGKKVNSFTNAEEIAVKLENVVPFMLEDALVERGAIFEHSGLWEAHVVSDQRLITGQNPASATGVGEAVLKELQQVTA